MEKTPTVKQPPVNNGGSGKEKLLFKGKKHVAEEGNICF